MELRSLDMVMVQGSESFVVDIGVRLSREGLVVKTNRLFIYDRV